MGEPLENPHPPEGDGRRVFHGIARCLFAWASVSVGLNLIWELAQLPLYTLWQRSMPETAFAVVHCTAGDLLIGVGCYWAAAIGTRRPIWVRDRAVLGASLASVAGLAYTALSEWANVVIRESWAYSAAMPTLFGIGVSPLIQWAAIPAAATFLTRRLILHP